jgi:hypothetical protein
MKKEKRKGTSTGGQTKKTGRKKKVHEKTSTHIGVGYFMYLSFRSMYFFFSHKYMKKYTDFRTSITALNQSINRGSRNESVSQSLVRDLK